MNEVFVKSALENIVFQTLAKQRRISNVTPEYVADSIGHYLTEEEYKRLRRAVRWTLTHASHGMLTISDEALKGILQKYGIEIRRDRNN